jgi:hypothetical protein
MIQCPSHPLSQGDVLFLRLGNLPWCSAKVIWHIEDYAGVMFDNALQEVVLHQLSDEPVATATPFTDPVDRLCRPLPPGPSVPIPMLVTLGKL